MGGTARATSSRSWLVWSALTLSAIGVFAVAALFAWPHGYGGPKTVNLGPANDYDVGSDTTIPDYAFHLVHLSADEFVALSWVDPHRGCTIPWRPNFEFTDPVTGVTKQGWFRDPCTGSTFDKDGRRVYGPAPCDMRRLPLSIVNGKVVVEIAPPSKCLAVVRSGS